jgi:hypothetical protein
VANPLNYVYNPCIKDHIPAPPKEFLYVVTPVPSLWEVALQMKFPSGLDPQQWRCAIVLEGSSSPIIDNQFPAGGPSGASVLMSWTGPLDVGTFEIWVGRDKDGHIDTATWFPVVVDNGKSAKIQVYSSNAYMWRYDFAAAGARGGGFLFGCPHAANLLKLFLWGVQEMGQDYRPSSTSTQPFNCLVCSSPLNDELSHNAGAPFDLSGGVALPEYIWYPPSKYSTLASTAPQFSSKEMEYFTNSVLPWLVQNWANMPNGHTAWLPSSSTYYELGAYEVDLVDPDNKDLHATFGTVRVEFHNVRFFVKKQANGYIYENIVREGCLIDLYDFSIVDDPTTGAHQSAAVQLGYGNGNKGAWVGKIYRTKVFFN